MRGAALDRLSVQGISLWGSGDPLRGRTFRGAGERRGTQRGNREKRGDRSTPRRREGAGIGDRRRATDREAGKRKMEYRG